MTKPANMPARKMRRQMRAHQPKNKKTEPTADQLSAARAIRTKKDRRGIKTQP